jgi:hypothetical protein
MKLSISIAVAVIVAVLFGCSATGMSVTTIDKSGRSETKNYTKNYSIGEWVSPGQVGIEIWIDHEKEVSPLHSLQQATGTLGPSDLRATGLITVYFVNLEQRPREVTDIVVSNIRGKDEPLQVKSSQLAPRALTKIVPGRVSISNYGTDVPLSVQFKLDGVAYSTSPTLKRRTDVEMQNPTKGFPWFEPPYYPFNPPLSLPK